MKLSFVVISLVILLVTFVYADGQIDISYSPYTISHSGSYIVVCDITTQQSQNAITILSNNVTLDLNGHTLYGAGTATGGINYGVYAESTCIYIVVKNGVIRNFRGSGINIAGDNNQILQIRAYTNGMYGIAIGSRGNVTGSIANSNLIDGINTGYGCTITDNCAAYNLGNGILLQAGGTVTGNSLSWNTYRGVFASQGCTIIGNTAMNNHESGFLVGDGSTVKDNTSCGNDVDGIRTGNYTQVIGNTCTQNGYFSASTGAGIRVNGSDNTIENNLVSYNDIGLRIDTAGNTYGNNRASSNSLSNYLTVGAQNDIGSGQINISYSPYTISRPGSYLVVSDITTGINLNAITIISNDVTVDLNGHTLYGAGTSAGTDGNGVYTESTCINITVKNGEVRDFRYTGVSISVSNSQAIQIRAYNNGGYGISIGARGIATGNIATFNVLGGIYADNGCTITGNNLSSNQSHGFYGNGFNTVIGNTIYYNRGCGIYTLQHSTIVDNTVTYSGSYGIQASSNCIIKDNSVVNSRQDGIKVNDNCRVVGNTAINSGYYANETASGIVVTGADNTIENNLLTGSDIGLLLNAAGNFYGSNRSSGNTLSNYSTIGAQTDGGTINTALTNVSFYYYPNPVIQQIAGFQIPNWNKIEMTPIRSIRW